MTPTGARNEICVLSHAVNADGTLLHFDRLEMDGELVNAIRALWASDRKLSVEGTLAELGRTATWLPLDARA